MGAEGLSVAVRWDVGGTGIEGDGMTWGRDRRLDGRLGMACTCLEHEPDTEKPIHTSRTGPAQTHPIRDTGLAEGNQQPSFLSDSGVPEPAMCVVTTAATDVHQPSVSSALSLDVPLKLGSSSTSESASRSACSSVTWAQSDSSQTLCSSTDCSATREEPSSEPSPSPLPPQQQDLPSSPSEDPCPSPKNSGPVPLASPSRLCPKHS